MPAKIVPLHTPEQVDINIDRVRRAYIRNRKHFIGAVEGEPSSYGDKSLNKWDGKKTAYGVQHKPVWPNITKEVSNITDDYEGYVNAQFQLLSAITHKIAPPQPNQLLCNTARLNYKNHVAHAPQFYNNKLKSEHNTFDMESDRIDDWYGVASDEAAWEMILSNTGNGLSPLFRFCVAYSEDLSYEIFQTEALDQLLLDPRSYLDYWKEIIPEPFMLSVPELLELETKLLTRDR